MKIHHYIVASFLSHLLLLSILVVTHTNVLGEVRLPVFDVDIVGLIEVPASLPPKGLKFQRFKGLKVSSPQSSPAPSPSPKTMEGEGTEKNSSIGLNSLNGLNSSTGNIMPDKKVASPSETDRPLFSPQANPPVAERPKSFLFDKETIEKFAKKSPQEKELTFDTSELKHRGYMRMLKDKIESIWKYPHKAARQGIAGDLYIKFSIKKDGRLGEVELMRTSGHKDLDEAAMKAIKDAEPYWPLPEDWDKDTLEITGHFIYLIGGGYMM